MMRLNRPGARGFTLIELMITVAIIGILAAVAYPSYQEHIRKSRRADAQADMMELAQWMERRFTLNKAYNVPAPVVLPFTQSPRTGTAQYNIDLQNLAGATYTVRAVPQGGQAADACGTMTITHTGATAATGAGPNCW